MGRTSRGRLVGRGRERSGVRGRKVDSDLSSQREIRPHSEVTRREEEGERHTHKHLL